MRIDCAGCMLKIRAARIPHVRYIVPISCRSILLFFSLVVLFPSLC